jgi:hypothetical protein
MHVVGLAAALLCLVMLAHVGPFGFICFRVYAYEPRRASHARGPSAGGDFASTRRNTVEIVALPLPNLLGLACRMSVLP